MATGRLPDPNTSPLTAKGDLYTYSTVPARLAVGSNGDSLVADSTATTGLRWASTPSASNPVINSAFDIWQRGTSIAGSSTAYTADRWQGYRTVAGSTFSRQATGDTTNLPNIQYCMRAQRDSGNTSTNILLLQYTMETADSIPFAGKTITFSFYARRGANFSSASNNLELNITSGTGTDQNGITGFTGAAAVINAQQSTLTTTWQRFTYTASVGTTATQLTWGFRYTPSGTAGAADFFEVTGIQIDIGSVALPYRRYASTIAGELAACQRYYWRQTAFSMPGGTQSGYDNTLYIGLNSFNAVPMRTTPTAAIESTPYITDYNSNVRTITSVNLIQKSSVGFVYDSTKLTTATSYAINFVDAGRALSFSAEL